MLLFINNTCCRGNKMILLINYSDYILSLNKLLFCFCHEKKLLCVHHEKDTRVKLAKMITEISKIPKSAFQ